MKLNLTKRWITHHQQEVTKEIYEGLEVEFYFPSDKSQIENPGYGKIQKDEDGFFIEWEDIGSTTRLDGSEYTEDILKDCGFRQI